MEHKECSGCGSKLVLTHEPELCFPCFYEYNDWLDLVALRSHEELMDNAKGEYHG